MTLAITLPDGTVITITVSTPQDSNKGPVAITSQPAPTKAPK